MWRACLLSDCTHSLHHYKWTAPEYVEQERGGAWTGLRRAECFSVIFSFKRIELVQISHLSHLSLYSPAAAALSSECGVLSLDVCVCVHSICEPCGGNRAEHSPNPPDLRSLSRCWNATSVLVLWAAFRHAEAAVRQAAHLQTKPSPNQTKPSPNQLDHENTQCV